ncbi:hypothetical protein ACFRAR_04170 [Kitasatospora sp. NPDC056651]|uniref:hypothetical protein n=1 Tax=Kitasatospora sp. NPDC056651 TaxID=3345892 RepID=UPI003675DC7F
MSKEIVTVCLPPTPPEQVEQALAAAMAPFDYDLTPEPGGPGWQGEWDYWSIRGGFADDEGFLVRPGHETDPRLIFEHTRPDGTARTQAPSTWDGGPRGLLDFDAARAPVTAKAAADWRTWQQFADAYPTGRPFAAFAERARHEPDTYPMERAREDFLAQPVIGAANTSATVCGTFPRYVDPIAYFHGTEEQFTRRRSAAVIPTPSLLTLDGRWINGDVRNWGEKHGLTGDYYEFADQHLENLPDDCLVVRVWYHC